MPVKKTAAPAKKASAKKTVAPAKKVVAKKKKQIADIATNESEKDFVLSFFLSFVVSSLLQCHFKKQKKNRNAHPPKRVGRFIKLLLLLVGHSFWGTILQQFPV